MSEVVPEVLKAINRQRVSKTPIWLMRQAGRYMKSYRNLREKYSILELCRNPELSYRVTMQPIERFPNIDAAIIFSDILVLLQSMGLRLHFASGEGPIIENPIKDYGDIETLRQIDAKEDLSFVLKAINLVSRELPREKALIGFCGAPFTLASYAIEGGSSKSFFKTRDLMNSQPDAWNNLMVKLSDAIKEYALEQSNAGADIIQIFDSWVGHISREEYIKYVSPYSFRIFKYLKDQNVPTIHFSTGTSDFLDLIANAGGDVISVDWKIEIDKAWEKIGHGRSIQGNLDPNKLAGSKKDLEESARTILKKVQGKNGFIFNLGHGVLPNTPEENVEHLIELVHHFN